MPIVATTPFDTAEYVLNLARSIVNDAAQTISGNLLSDSQPYTFPMLNSVYRTMQEDLTDGGVETFTQETILTQVPITAFPNDPSVQVYINYTGCFDGYNTTANPHLPAGMIGPLRLWERQSGNTAACFREMQPTNDGLPSRPAYSYLQQWEWRNDTLYFCGALQQNDIRLRYNQYFPDLVDGDSQVQIPRADRALSYLLGREFAAARGSQMFQYMADNYEMAMERFIKRTARRKQRGSHRRRPYGSSNAFYYTSYGSW